MGVVIYISATSDSVHRNCVFSILVCIYVCPCQIKTTRRKAAEQCGRGEHVNLINSRKQPQSTSVSGQEEEVDVDI